jgi:hypothetical protein
MMYLLWNYSSLTVTHDHYTVFVKHSTNELHSLLYWHLKNYLARNRSEMCLLLRLTLSLIVSRVSSPKDLLIR